MICILCLRFPINCLRGICPHSPPTRYAAVSRHFRGNGSYSFTLLPHMSKNYTERVDGATNWDERSSWFEWGSSRLTPFFLEVTHIMDEEGEGTQKLQIPYRIGNVTCRQFPTFFLYFIMLFHLFLFRPCLLHISQLECLLQQCGTAAEQIAKTVKVSNDHYVRDETWDPDVI